MKILITGANGLLGSTIFDYLTEKGENVFKYNRSDFSWIDQKKNILALRNFDVVIHAAANTNVEECEIYPESCYRDNTLFTERLSSAASQVNCKFIFISSTGIYGSEKENSPYTEYDNVNPTTHHHKSKWLAEQAVNKFCNNSLILRTGWIFGGLPNSSKNFITNRIREALVTKNNKIISNCQQFGVPTYTKDFAEILYLMILKDEIGTYNIVNQGHASRFDYVSKIFKTLSLETEVIPDSAESFNRIAKVSKNEMAVSLKLKELGYQLLPTWEESIEKYIKNDLQKWLLEHKSDGKG